MSFSLRYPLIDILVFLSYILFYSDNFLHVVSEAVKGKSITEIPTIEKTPFDRKRLILHASLMRKSVNESEI